jgi:hypothetical protein
LKKIKLFLIIMADYPEFDNLPQIEGQPQGNAWGLFGRDDELGSKSNTNEYSKPEQQGNRVSQYQP